MTHLLTINTGSSSLKATVYDMGHGEAILLVQKTFMTFGETPK